MPTQTSMGPPPAPEANTCPSPHGLGAQPVPAEVLAYLHARRPRLAELTYRDYHGSLMRFAHAHNRLLTSALEPPDGTWLIETYLADHYAHLAARTYNKNLSVLRGFTRHLMIRGKLHRDPTLPLERARSQRPHRMIFNAAERCLLIEAQPSIRERLCLQLLLDYGLRKGALRAVQFKHFDAERRRLTIFTKGAVVRELPIVSPGFWEDLNRHKAAIGAAPEHYLLCRRYWQPVDGRHELRYMPSQPIGTHGTHNWWYRCLERAGITQPGVRSGHRLHNARHTAGQRVLDHTGNLKAVQMLLGHASIQTTGDIYTDWEIGQLTATMEDVLGA